jgi:hypothetical protein
MQRSFSLLPLDHLASKFDFFVFGWLCGFLKKISKIFPH